MGQKQHRESLKYLQPFFDLPAQPTKIDQKRRFSTSVFPSVVNHPIPSRTMIIIIFNPSADTLHILLRNIVCFRIVNPSADSRIFRRGSLFFTDFLTYHSPHSFFAVLFTKEPISTMRTNRDWRPRRMRRALMARRTN